MWLIPHLKLPPIDPGPSSEAVSAYRGEPTDRILVAMTTTAAKKYSVATPAQVWSLLRDGSRYADWVHGTKEIRAVDVGWPEVGTGIHYTAGIGPLTYQGETTVRTSEPERRLELEVHAWPGGTVRVNIEIESSGNGSIVTLDEHPLRGPVRLLHNPLSRLGFLARTNVMIDDLLRLAERQPA
jgi:carbon monoxide dehydrogenase subunit G